MADAATPTGARLANPELSAMRFALVRNPRRAKPGRKGRPGVKTQLDIDDPDLAGNLAQTLADTGRLELIAVVRDQRERDPAPPHQRQPGQRLRPQPQLRGRRPAAPGSGRAAWGGCAAARSRPRRRPS